MRLFIYEYLSSMAWADYPDSLISEGWCMLDAIVRDFVSIPGLELTTLLAAEPMVRSNRWPGRVKRVASDPIYEEKQFQACAAHADLCLVIAPEFSRLLHHRCRLVEQVGSRLLGPSAEAVALTTDKLALADRWQEAGVPTPTTWQNRPSGPGPWVVKPRDGAGSQATFQIHDDEDWSRAQAIAKTEGWNGEWIWQPLLPGLAASVSFLLGPRQRLALPPFQQLQSQDGRFHYLGSRGPLTDEASHRAQAIATQAVAAVPGLAGYVGVDVVLGETTDWAIEINPRLTTSYLALHRLCRVSLARALLEVFEGGVVDLEWLPGPLEFRLTDAARVSAE